MASATQVRRVVLQVTTEDGDTEAKIAAINAAADDLSKKHPELKVKIDTAAASAKVKVLRAEIAAAAKSVEAEPIKPKVEPIKPKVDIDPAKVKIAELQRDLARLRLEKQGIRIDVDASEAEIKIAELKAQIEALGSDSATAVNRGFRLRMSPMVAGWTSLITLGMAGLPMAAAAVGALAGAALGAKLLIGTKAVQGPLYKQFHDMTATLVSVMRVAALPLVKPLADAFAQIGLWAKQMEPLISRAFASVGPLIQPLATGLEGLVSGVLPGFITLMKAGAPAVSALAGVLSTLSRAVGTILSGMAPAVRASSGVWLALARVIQLLAPVAASLAGSLATALAPALRSVAGVVQVLAPVLSRVGGLLASLAGTALTLVSRALSAVLPYAAQMVAIMANGLMPVLPPLISAVSQVASVFTAQLGRSLATLMPGIEQVTQATLGLLQHVILPLLPNILTLTADFSQLQIQAIVPLIPPVLQLAGVLLQLTDQVIVPMMPTIERVTGVLVQMANAALTAISLVSKALSLFGVASGGGAVSVGGYGGYAGGQEGGGNAGEGGGLSTAGYNAGVAAGSAYGGAWADGGTSAAKKAAKARAAAKPVTAASLALILAGGAEADLTGTAAQVRAGVAKLIAAVTQDERAGVLSQSQGSALTLWLDKDSTRLQGLANKRMTILREIAAAQKYAASVATSIRNTDNLQSAAAGGWNGGPQTNAQIVANLRTDVVNIRNFATNVEKLRKLGLNRTYLAQLIQMGPDAGGQLAQQLADSGLGNIRQINQAESQIVQVSGYLGKTAANAMYDSGVNAGKGFLSGLEAQQGALEKMMQKLAVTLVNTLRRDLGIHSASTVARQLGREWPNGLVLGMEDGHAGVQTASSRLARALVPGRGAGGAAGGGYGGGRVLVEFDFRGVPPQVRTWLKKQIRVTGGDPAVIGA